MTSVDSRTAVQNTTSLPMLPGSTRTSAGGGYVGLETTSHLLAGHPLFQATLLLNQASFPVIVIVGVFGNTMILILQGRLDRGGQGSCLSVLISALSVSDSVMLVVSGVSRCLGFTFQIVTIDFHDVSCKLIFWVVYVTGLTSSWFLVVMTVQRATSILWPHRAGAVWTVKAGKWTVVIIVLMAMLLNAHILYGRRLQLFPTGERFCLYESEEYRQFFDEVWPVVDTILSSFLPFLLIMVSNTVLVRRVRQSMKEARDKLMTSQSDQLQTRQQQTSSMTLTLVCVSIAFFLLTSPLCLYFVLQRTGGYVAVSSMDGAAQNFLMDTIGNVLWMSNNAVNFYIYLGTGSRYRRALVELFSCRGNP